MSEHFLAVEHLTKDFGGLAAVKDISFDVYKNEIIGLIGPNGAGKTTLFNLVTGMERIDSGKVYFKGKDISKLKPHNICKLGISRTYQSGRPFLNHTVRENVTVGALFGRPHSDQKKNVAAQVDEIIDLLNLRKKEQFLAKNLPIEERKLVEVGRALAANPLLLMLDEPMAGLNPNEVSKFVSLIKKLNVERSLTIFIVEHLIKAISSACTRVIVMHHGELLSQGTPTEVLADTRVIDVYLGESYGKQQTNEGSKDSTPTS